EFAWSGPFELGEVSEKKNRPTAQALQPVRDLAYGTFWCHVRAIKRKDLQRRPPSSRVDRVDWIWEHIIIDLEVLVAAVHARSRRISVDGFEADSEAADLFGVLR